MKSLMKKYYDFVKGDIWRVQSDELTRKRSFFLKQLRVLILAGRDFGRDRCQLRASALTFYTMLSIVPVAALIFGIAKGLGFEVMLQEALAERFTGYEEILANVMKYSSSLLENTRGGTMAVVGIAVLLWTVVKVLGQIELSFNDIWNIKKPRTFARKVSDYLSLMLVGPILIILSSSVTVFIRAQVALLGDDAWIYTYIGPVIQGFITLLPFILMWIVFALLYILMPNTKVKLGCGIKAAIFAGTAYQLVQWGFLHFQVGMARYNAIYGSFAAVPLFMIWLEISWMIVLFGGEVAYASQNVESYEFEEDCADLSIRFRRLMALYVGQLLAHNFATEDPHPTASEIALRLALPVRLVREVLGDLERAGVISETLSEKGRRGDPVFQPAHSLDILTVEYVIESLDRSGSDAIPIKETPELVRLKETLAKFEYTLEESPENTLLRDV